MKRIKNIKIIVGAVVIYVCVSLAHTYLFAYGPQIDQKHNKWYYSILFLVVFFATTFSLIKRANQGETDFKKLFNTGLIISILANFISVISSQVYYSLLSDQEKVRIVDGMVDSRIKNYKGNDLDIFKIEDAVNLQFELDSVILGIFATVLLQILLIVIIALVFSREKKSKGFFLSRRKSSNLGDT